jgi:hypothetical protein
MVATTMAVTTMMMATMTETMAMTTLRDASDVLCGLPSLHLGALRICRRMFQAMEAIRKRMEDLERMVGDNYKFLNRNVRKLFGMVGNMKGTWCNNCGKYH